MCLLWGSPHSSRLGAVLSAPPPQMGRPGLHQSRAHDQDGVKLRPRRERVQAGCQRTPLTKWSLLGVDEVTKTERTLWPREGELAVPWPAFDPSQKVTQLLGPTGASSSPSPSAKAGSEAQPFLMLQIRHPQALGFPVLLPVPLPLPPPRNPLRGCALDLRGWQAGDTDLGSRN